MTDAPELKPCPFCGGHASVWTTDAYSCDSAEHVLGCQSCDIFTPFASAFASNKPTETDAAAWNTRADLHQQALEAARAEGYAQAVEEAVRLCAEEFAEHMTMAICGEKDNARNRESAASMAEKLLHAIRALAQKEGE